MSGVRLLGLLAVALGVMASGCASLTRTPPDLDLHEAEIVADATPPELHVDGHSGKGSAAGFGAAKGFGTGAAAGTVACLGTGPLFGLCILAVVPVTTTIGTVGWATAAAVTAESADAVEAKRAFLQADLATAPYPALLAAGLHDAALKAIAIDLPVAAAPGGVPRPWRIELAVTELACEDNKPGQGYALRVEARVRLRRAGHAEPAWERTRVDRSESSRTTAQWRADEASAARASLVRSLKTLADAMLNDLLQRPRAAR